MKQNVALSILTPFSSKSTKKWEGAAQKTELDEGVRGGLKITIYVIFLVLYPFSPVLKLMYVFQGFEKKFNLSFFRKRLFYTPD